METGIKSSFIPQSPITPLRTEARTTRRGFDFLILVTIVIFVASIALAGAVFLYEQYLSTSEASKSDQLERAKSAFEPSLIHDLTRLDDRMRSADQILESHTAPSAPFYLLEQLTLQTVSFTTFDFSTTPDGASVTMQGIAASVNSIALQADLLSRSGMLANPIFSNINRQIGGVRFDFTADIVPGSLSFGPAEEQIQEQVVPEMPASPFGTPTEPVPPTQ